MGIKNYEIRIGDLRFDSISFGSGQKDLVIIPGLGDGLSTVKGKAWAGRVIFRKCARKYRVTVISRRRDLQPGATTGSMAKDQALAMEALGIRKAHVVGISQGGMIAQHLAADHPEMVDRLVLAVSAPSCSELARENISRWVGFAKMGSYLGLIIDTTEKAHPEKYLRRIRPLYPYLGSMAKKMDVSRFCIMAGACLSHNTQEKLDKITAPTLVIGGGADRTLGVDGSHQLHRLIDGSILKIYEDQGHALSEDEPDFYKTVLSFLQAED